MAPTLPRGAILPVAGVSYRQGAVRDTHVGQAVLLSHDVTNEHDRWAVAVHTCDGRALGYLPATAGLAARLSRNVPGGRWAGHITEVLPGQTWGLRITVDELIDVGDTRVGSNIGGVRDRGEDEHTPGEPSAPVHIYDTIGRCLGILIDRTDTLTTVQADDGTLKAYPNTVIANGNWEIS